jgi:hypothetical protein
VTVFVVLAEGPQLVVVGTEPGGVVTLPQLEWEQHPRHTETSSTHPTYTTLRSLKRSIPGSVYLRNGLAAKCCPESVENTACI